jgi:hypothetical protein
MRAEECDGLCLISGPILLERILRGLAHGIALLHALFEVARACEHGISRSDKEAGPFPIRSEWELKPRWP